jgi:very-short-patch-repair endonuclease
MKERQATALVLRMARRNGHVVTRSQVFREGVTGRQLAGLVETGALVRFHRGIFVEGAVAADPVVVIRAGLAYAGPAAVASHRTAAWLQGLVARPGNQVHITLPFRSHRNYSGLATHHSRPLASLSAQGVRCTTPARTIVDLAPSLSGSEVNDVIDIALTKGLTTPVHLAEEVAHPRRGAAIVRRSLKGLGHIDVPDSSVLEALFRRLIHKHRLPVPRTQVAAGLCGQYRVDNSWGRQRVIAEVNGYAWHHSPEQMNYDSARQRELTLAGWTVLVFTWLQVVQQPDEVARDLWRALAERAA